MIDGKARCTTSWYVTSDRNEAERLAKIDNTPVEEIDCVEGVEPLCVEPRWSYWSDGKFSGGSYSGEKPPEGACPISMDAKSFLNDAAGSDSGFPRKNVRDMLVEAKRVEKVKEHPVSSGFRYAGKRVMEYDVELPGGKKEKLFVSTMGYPGGYMFEVERSLAEAKKNFSW